MHRDAARGPAAILAGVAIVGAGACDAGLPHPPYVPQTTASLRRVGYPPPPARVEVIPNRPAGDPVWLDGEWSWEGSAWGWIAGRWVAASPGTLFAPWTTVRDADGEVYFASGAWRDAAGTVVPPPPTLATAVAAEGAVTSPSGRSERTTRAPEPPFAPQTTGHP